MEIKVIDKNIKDIKADLVAFATTEEAYSKLKTLTKLDSLIKLDKDFKAEANQIALFYDSGNIKRFVLIGLGKEKELTLEKIRRAYSVLISGVKEIKQENLHVVLPSLKKFSDKDLANAITESIILTDYKFDKYKTDKKDIKHIKTLQIVSKSKIKDAVEKAKTISDNVNFVRDLVNECSEYKNPLILEKIAKQVAKKAKLKIKVFDEKKLTKLGMNLILNVSSGSRYPARLIILEYNKGKTKEKIAFVGKGITFDSGGLNLKPSGYMETMKLDMAGAATCLGIIKTASELKLKTNIIAVLPVCENMIGSKSYKPSHIVKSYSGKTVEVGNTDAEGRLILADAMAYTEKNLKPNLIIDLATLTGAVHVALGDLSSGLMTNNEKIVKKLYDVGETVSDRIWQLPLYEDYKEVMKGELADINNISNRKGGFAGTITAATFLNNFVEKTTWMHLDIASTAFLEQPRFYNPKGATGAGLRLLINYLSSLKPNELKNLKASKLL